MDIKDIHISVYDANTGIQKTTNANKAHSQGIEVDFDQDAAATIVWAKKIS